MPKASPPANIPGWNRFASYLYDTPWFFVPDTGTPGGTARAVCPNGDVIDATDTQITTDGRVGFLFGRPWLELGDHHVTVTQDDVVTEYVFTVFDKTAPDLDAQLKAWQRAATQEG